MNCIWWSALQISIYCIICIDTQRSWWTDEFGDSNYLTSEQKSVHHHRHHHHLTRQSVRHKFMADEAHNVDSQSTHDPANGNGRQSEFRNQKTGIRNGNRQSNKKHNTRRGQWQKHNKNGNRTRRDQTTFSISLFYYIIAFISVRKVFALYSARTVYGPRPFSIIFF